MMLCARCFCQGLLLASVVSTLAGCNRGLSDRDIKLATFPEVSKLVAADAGRANPRLVLIDPRAREDYEAAHLPKARRQGPVPFDGKVDRDIINARDVIVYGENPASPLGRGMTKRLMELGVGNVRFYAGGIEEWKRLGGAVEAGAGTEGRSATR